MPSILGGIIIVAKSGDGVTVSALQKDAGKYEKALRP